MQALRNVDSWRVLPQCKVAKGGRASPTETPPPRCRQSRAVRWRHSIHAFPVKSNQKAASRSFPFFLANHLRPAHRLRSLANLQRSRGCTCTYRRYRGLRVHTQYINKTGAAPREAFFSFRQRYHTCKPKHLAKFLFVVLSRDTRLMKRHSSPLCQPSGLLIHAPRCALSTAHVACFFQLRRCRHVLPLTS